MSFMYVCLVERESNTDDRWRGGREKCGMMELTNKRGGKNRLRKRRENVCEASLVGRNVEEGG